MAFSLELCFAKDCIDGAKKEVVALIVPCDSQLCRASRTPGEMLSCVEGRNRCSHDPVRHTLHAPIDTLGGHEIPLLMAVAVRIKDQLCLL